MRTIIYLVVFAGLLLGIAFLVIPALGAIEKIGAGHTMNITRIEQDIDRP